MIKSWGHECILHVNSFKRFPGVSYAVVVHHFPRYLMELHSPGDPDCVLQLSNTPIPRFYSQKTATLFARDAIWFLVKIHHCRIIPSRTSQHLGYFYPHTLKCTHSSINWPNLAAMLHGYPGPCRLHTSLYLKKSLSIAFSLLSSFQ